MRLRHPSPSPAATCSPAFRLKPSAAIVLSVLGLLGFTGASDAVAAPTGKQTEFDTIFLQVDPKQSVDIPRISQGNLVTPGAYVVDVWMNDARVAHDELRFDAAPDGGSARPCLTRITLEKYGVDFAKVGIDNKDFAKIGADACVDLSTAIPGAQADFDFEEQKLAITVPQKYMRNTARGYVPPELWDNGVSAAFLNYNASAYRANGNGVRSQQEYLGLNAGVNVGGWHFRHQSSITSGTGQPTQLDNIATYVQHDVPKLRAQATFGDSQTTGDVFDSVSFRGAQLATDDRMSPESLRGYAPLVRGVADSNARVTVRQNGQVIYETTVPPGPFEINDLYATGYGGNLDVTVTEADGRTKQFSVPYASVPQLLRPGTTRFAFTAGQLRDDSLETKPEFAQVTVQRGITNSVTLYGGAIASTGYAAVNMGAALNTKYGAFASDVTAARTEIPGTSTAQGYSLHIGYSKLVDSTNTNISVGAYRFSSANYLSFADAARVRDVAMHGTTGDTTDRQRGRLQLTLNQSLKDHGSVYADVSSQSYWNRPGRDLFYQVGYSNVFKYGTYSVSANRMRDASGTMSNEIMLSTSIPLGHSQHAPQLTTNLNLGSGSSNLQANISGTAGEHNQYSYNAYGSATQDSSASTNATAGASGAWRTPYAQLNASASGGVRSSQVSVGASGSIVAHPGGITLSQTVGDTFAVVEAKGAEGASVSNATGVKVNSHGYAVVPYLTPYGMNTVDLDPKGTSADVEFESTSEKTAPHFGSIVMLKYKTMNGRAALIRAPQSSGEPLPFGADVADQNGRSVGTVAQDSRIFVRGIEDSGTLVVKWGENGQQCSIRYALPTKAKKSDAVEAYDSVESHCLPAPSGVTASNGNHGATD
ncbi:fimbria/pilus outer membrane usher protein [Burkholderia sp. Ax-1719]|uniref:fimbria/pilus outer membrane usher protein n=1 Tax=Burkholderia sp. Ax-1719 TaxID=2608334 RepID=UPI00141E4C12|nr:fimbria/pilus outer membrane usher protein [Burkholderia sp. Ax-1719]NIE64483.1 fimbrial biogenesis outer membrane usher protein [Burkholderia sp. Ax-1719]